MLYVNKPTAKNVVIIENGISLESNSTNLKNTVEVLKLKIENQKSILKDTTDIVSNVNKITTENTTKSNEMNKLAKNVNKSAIDGKELANSTNKAMVEITQKVDAISEAVKIIDQIAFQTNILSLNAAVEAATAGEHCKGFAVVAQEVRTLAAKSAEAADEIKQIVDTAKLQTERGKEQSNSMIKGYDLLNKEIEKTIDFIEDVNEGSKQQKQAFGEINESIDRIRENSDETNIETEKVNDISSIMVEEAKSKKI